MTEPPTPTEVRKARKAELVAWCESFGLDPEGKVDELRKRILAHLESAGEEPSAPPEPTPEGEAAAVEPEEPAEAEEPEAAPEEEEKEEAEGAGAEKAHVPKAKPKLDSRMRSQLQVRREIARRRPRFVRQEWFRDQRLGEIWRKPQGRHTKLRRHFGYRPNVVSIGYRGPKAVRGLHPSGFREVLVHNVRELEAIDAKVEAARIAGSVGTRLRTEIQAAADEKGIRVLNRRGEE